MYKNVVSDGDRSRGVVAVPTPSVAVDRHRNRDRFASSYVQKRQFELTKVQSNHVAAVYNLQWIYPSYRLRQLELRDAATGRQDDRTTVSHEYSPKTPIMLCIVMPMADTEQYH